MDVTRLEQRAYITIAILGGSNARECHSEFVEDAGKNALPYRISRSHYDYFYADTLFWSNHIHCARHLIYKWVSIALGAIAVELVVLYYSVYVL